MHVIQQYQRDNGPYMVQRVLLLKSYHVYVVNHVKIFGVSY